MYKCVASARSMSAKLLKKWKFSVCHTQEESEDDAPGSASGGAGSSSKDEKPITSQPTTANSTSSTNPFAYAMPPPSGVSATENTSLNPADKISYTPGKLFSTSVSTVLACLVVWFPTGVHVVRRRISWIRGRSSGEILGSGA